MSTNEKTKLQQPEKKAKKISNNLLSFEDCMGMIELFQDNMTSADIQTEVRAYIQSKKEFEEKLSKMLNKFLYALNVYAEIRVTAKEKNIIFNQLGRYGVFASYYRSKFRYRRTIESNARWKKFCREFAENRPKMEKLLNSEELNMTLVKEAILEDLYVSCVNLNRECKTYKQYQAFASTIETFAVK